LEIQSKNSLSSNIWPTGFLRLTLFLIDKCKYTIARNQCKDIFYYRDFLLKIVLIALSSHNYPIGFLLLANNASFLLKTRSIFAPAAVFAKIDFTQNRAELLSPAL